MIKQTSFQSFVLTKRMHINVQLSQVLQRRAALIDLKRIRHVE